MLIGVKVEDLELSLSDAKRTIVENEKLHVESSKICAKCKGKSSVDEIECKSSWNMLENIISKLDVQFEFFFDA